MNDAYNSQIARAGGYETVKRDGITYYIDVEPSEVAF